MTTTDDLTNEQLQDEMVRAVTGAEEAFGTPWTRQNGAAITEEKIRTETRPLACSDGSWAYHEVLWAERSEIDGDVEQLAGRLAQSLELTPNEGNERGMNTIFYGAGSAQGRTFVVQEKPGGHVSFTYETPCSSHDSVREHYEWALDQHWANLPPTSSPQSD